MSQMVTKCPQCATTFRVTDAQLQAAKGKVRCGSCLHVFKADENWAAKPAAPVAEPQAEQQPQQSNGTSASKFQFDQAAIDGGSAEGVLQKSSLASAAEEAAKTEEAIQASKEPDPVDELGDDELIGDDSELYEDQISDTTETDAVQSDSITSEFSDDFLNLDDLQNDDFSTSEFDAVSGGGSTSDESWAKDLLDELEDDSEERAAHAEALLSGEADEVFSDDSGYKPSDKKPPRKKAPEPEDFSNNQFFNEDDFVVNNQVDVAKDLGLEQEPVDSKSLLDKIEPAPVEIDWSRPARNWLGMAIWSSLSLLMAAGLVLQYGWINFESLAREEQFRPWYRQACDVAGCELPDLFNPASIKSKNLVVRSHPEHTNVLVVDAILQNGASYKQPFPYLELYFSDIDNFPVASRRFTPAEYLAGELAGKKIMPVAKSIHISLEIADPGSEAVNYRLQIARKNPLKS